MSANSDSLRTVSWKDWLRGDRLFAVLSAVALVLGAFAADFLAPPANLAVAAVLFVVSLAAFVRFQWF